MKIVSVLCLVVLTAACSRKSGPAYEYALVGAFPDSVELKCDTMPMDLLNPIGVYHVGDYLLVLTDIDNRFLQIYDANTCDSLGGFFTKGRGPYETPGMIAWITQIYPEPGNNRVWITGNDMFKGLFNIDRSLEEGRIVFEKEFDFMHNEKLPYAMTRMVSNWNVNDSVFMWMEHAYRIMEDQPNRNNFYIHYDYKNDKVLDTVWVSNYRVRNESEVLSVEICGGFVRPDLKKAACPFRYMDRVHIVDLETKDVKVLGFDNMPDANIPTPSASPAKDAWYSTGEEGTQNHIIIGQREGRSRDGRDYLSVLTWDGEPVMKIIIDQKLFLMNITADRRYLYGITNPEQKIVRYDISALNL